MYGLRRRRLRDLFFEIAEQKLQLIDCAAQLLRGGAEPLAQQPRQTQLQLLVTQHLLFQSVACRLQFGCLLCQFRRLLLQRSRMIRLALQQQAAQRDYVVRQSCGIERRWHVQIVQYRLASLQVISCPRRRFFQPAISGRQVRTGMRQSMPSSEGLQEYPLW